MRANRRGVLLVSLIVAAGVAMAFQQDTPRSAPVAIAYVATAHQLGVVGYRDPVGAISPDGTRIGFVEGRRVFVQPIGGGARVELAVADGQIRHIAWLDAALVFEGSTAGSRWWIAKTGERPAPLFGSATELRDEKQNASVRVNDLRQIAGAPDGRTIAAIATGPSGAQLWRAAAGADRGEVASISGAPSFPAWTHRGEIACIITAAARARLSIPCGQPVRVFDRDVEIVGPMAFAPDDRTVYFASPNSRGTVDLWSADLSSGRARVVSNFARDTYAPSVARDGTTLFKSQTYRTSIAEVDLTTGTLRDLTAFQAETPSYDPSGRKIAVTFGTWRRVIDDAKYPDIAQDIGLIAAGPAATVQRQPIEVIAQSDSEDQAMAWSPNGKWIAFHSHRDLSDDIWLRPADGSSSDRRISLLGRGAEVGWPRWSPDGRMVLFDGASPRTRRSVAFTVGVDQNSGKVISEPKEVELTGIAGELMHAEWLPDSRTLVAIAKEGPGRHVIFTAPAAGGAARVLHRLESEHDFPGLGVAPDGRTIAFVGPATDGTFQIFTLAVSGGAPRQVTFDRSNKTQPAWSPDGQRLALTIWDYVAQFWTF